MALHCSITEDVPRSPHEIVAENFDGQCRGTGVEDQLGRPPHRHVRRPIVGQPVVTPDRVANERDPSGQQEHRPERVDARHDCRGGGLAFHDAENQLGHAPVRFQ